MRTSYDVMPLSFRLIVFDTALLVKSSLTILIQNGMKNLHVKVKTQSLTMGLNKFESFRDRLRAAMGFKDLDLRRLTHHV